VLAKFSVFGIALACAAYGCSSGINLIYVLNSHRQSPAHPTPRQMAPRPASPLRQDSLPGDETFDGRRQVSAADAGLDAVHMPDVKTNFARRRALRRRPIPDLWRKSIRQRPDDHGHRPLESTCAPAVVGHVAEVEANYGIPRGRRHHRCFGRSGSRQSL